MNSYLTQFQQLLPTVTGDVAVELHEKILECTLLIAQMEAHMNDYLQPYSNAVLDSVGDPEKGIFTPLFDKFFKDSKRGGKQTRHRRIQCRHKTYKRK